jgi:hypothetical protein
MVQALQVYEPNGDIQVSRAPELVLEEARRAAVALVDVLSKKQKPVIMNGEQYLEFEDWQTVGRFYGLTAKVKETEFLDYGGVQGFLAKAVVVRSDGMEISAAEAMCMNDEEKWSSRPKYGYLYVLKDGTKQEEEPPSDQMVWVDNPKKAGKKLPKKERTLLGETCVPLFQLRSMAQTRACAKALRNVLAWVVVLAGYKPTVAEELTGDEEPPKDPGKPPLKEPQKKGAKPADKPADPPPENKIGLATVSVTSIELREGVTDGKPWKMYGITGDDGNAYKTFSETLADIANTAKQAGQKIQIDYKENKNGRTIRNMQPVEVEGA